MPESTIAIVAAGAPLYLSTPVTYGHFSLLSTEADAAERRTRASGVIAVMCLSLASARSCAPLSWTATPSIERKALYAFLSAPSTSAIAFAAWLPPLPWTMTLKAPVAFDCADDRSDGVTNAVGPSAFDGLADAPSGTSTTRANVARSAVRRLPLPHKAFERESPPRLPLPHSALARTPRRRSPFRIPTPLLSKPQLTRRNVESRPVQFVTLLGHAAKVPPSE